MRFKKCVTMLLGASFITFAGQAMAGGPGVLGPDAVASETLVFTAQSAQAPHLPPLKVIGHRHHSVGKLTTFEIVSPRSTYKSLTVLSSDPFETTAPIRHYVDRITFTSSPLVVTLKGTVDTATGNSSGKWSGSDQSYGTYTVTR